MTRSNRSPSALWVLILASATYACAEPLYLDESEPSEQKGKAEDESDSTKTPPPSAREAALGAEPKPIAPKDESTAKTAHTRLAIAGFDIACFIHANGEVHCARGGTRNYVPDGIPERAVSVVSGDSSHCALTEKAVVYCWGNGEFIGARRRPMNSQSAVEVLRDVVEITSNEGNFCALMTTGGWKCWGDNRDGLQGTGSKGEHRTPVDATLLATSTKALALGKLFACGLSATGAVSCWGNNSAGQLGDGTTASRLTMAPANGLASGVVALEASTCNGCSFNGTEGGASTCALRDSGEVWCWGSNTYAVLGIDARTANQLTPRRVNGITGATKLAITETFACAAGSVGNVKCWGHLPAPGSTARPHSLTPVDLPGIAGADVVEMHGRWFKACAVLKNDTVKCWGFGDAFVPSELSL